jgi:transmembrane protein EpsG
MVFRRAFAIWLASLSFSDLYMMYAESTYKSGTYTFTALILLIAFFGWIFMKPVLEANPGSFRYFNAMAIAIVLTPLTWVDPSLMRVVQYFSVFMLVLIPAIVNAVITYPVALRTWTYAIMIAALIYLIAKVGLDYKFMWQPMKVEGISY